MYWWFGFMSKEKKAQDKDLLSKFLPLFNEILPIIINKILLSEGSFSQKKIKRNSIIMKHKIIRLNKKVKLFYLLISILVIWNILLTIAFFFQKI